MSSLYSMFQAAAAFNQPIGDWDVSSVTNMYSMFQAAAAFNQPIGDWDVSLVTNMYFMFRGAAAFSSDITGWDTPAVISSQGMFLEATAWTTMYARSDGMENSDGPPSAWSDKRYCGDNHFVSSGACEPCAAGYVNARGDDSQGGADTTCGECAENYRVASGVACDLGYINAAGDDAEDGSDTTCTRRTFASLEELKAAILACADPCDEASAWDVSQLTSLSGAFSGRSGFNADISGWDVSSVTNMNSMFSGAAAFNQPIGDWDVSSVTNMGYMFTGAAAFSSDITGWDTPALMYSYGSYGMFLQATAWDHHVRQIRWDAGFRFRRPSFRVV